MTQDGASESGARRVLDDVAAEIRVGKRTVALSLLRSVGVVVLTLVVYSAVPIREHSSAVASGIAAGSGMVVVGVVFVRQLMRVSRAPHPTLAAIEALALVFGMFVTMLALVYVSLSVVDADSFSEPMDKVSGIYFSVTVLSTVGFGDIAPRSDWARVAVTFQMVVDLILVGSAVKLLASSARRAVQARHASVARPTTEHSGLHQDPGPGTIGTPDPQEG